MAPLTLPPDLPAAGSQPGPSPGAGAGIAIAIPVIGLMSWRPEAEDRRAARAGVLYGLLAGVGFALLFVALDQAGTHAGALAPDSRPAGRSAAHRARSLTAV
jgi:hypothetical protein